jgi:hypothetical protein
MTHYVVKRDAAGVPTALVWSPDIQRAGAQMAAQRALEQRLAEVARTRPMLHLEAWARERGLWRPEAEEICTGERRGNGGET